MANEVKTIREADNSVKICGWLKEKNFEFKTQEAKGQEEAYDYVTGTVTVEVAENENHIIHFYQKALTKAGKENNFYKGFQTIDSEYVSMASYLAENPNANITEARENATKMYVTGSLSENTYTDENGKFISSVRIRGNSCNRAKADKFNPHATFSCEIFIDKISKEIVKEEETGRVFVDGSIVGYEGNLSCMRFIAPKKYEDVRVADHVLENYRVNDTVQISGVMVSLREEIEKTKAVKGFGVQVHKETSVKFVNELLITAGSYEGYDKDSESAYSKDLITKLKARREAAIEEKQSKSSTSTSSSSGNSNVGFGEKKASAEVKKAAQSFEF